MLKAQMMTLDATGNDCLTKARACTSLKDAREFTELGMKCLQESRLIFDQIKQNSVFLFIELSIAAGYQPTFAAYLQFAARNRLDIVSETDFEAVSGGVLRIEGPE
jgi:hypothetical protein